MARQLARRFGKPVPEFGAVSMPSLHADPAVKAQYAEEPGDTPKTKIIKSLCIRMSTIERYLEGLIASHDMGGYRVVDGLAALQDTQERFERRFMRNLNGQTETIDKVVDVLEGLKLDWKKKAKAQDQFQRRPPTLLKRMRLTQDDMVQEVTGHGLRSRD